MGTKVKQKSRVVGLAEKKGNNSFFVDDGMDETICPQDYQRAGMITDDELFGLIVAPLPAGCRLTAIFDCCHSGSGLDLPFMYDWHGRSIGGKGRF